MVKEKKTKTIITIATSQGEHQVEERDIIHFGEGIPGFSEYKDFVFFDIQDCEPFKSMLSIDENGPDFVVIEPVLVFDDYNPIVTATNIGDPDIGNPDDLVVLSIVTLAEKPEDITVNLRGPLLINSETSQGLQLILDNEQYTTKVSMANLV